MERKFVKLKDINIWGGCHIQTDDGFYVRHTDGKTTEEHLEGIEFFKELLLKGNKVVPPLVTKEKNGKYREWDGFKRIKAYQELGLWDTIEVFVAKPGEKEEFMGHIMEGRPGGQSYELFTEPMEGDECEPFSQTILAEGGGLRIELRENIHLHWTERGWSRVVLGQRDFRELAKAFINGRSKA